MNSGIIDTVISIISVGIALAPVAISASRLIAQKTHSTTLMNLTNRASVIVSALQNSHIDNLDKKELAMNSIANYAKELGVKLTPDQASEYIEDAVRVMNQLFDQEVK